MLWKTYSAGGISILWLCILGIVQCFNRCKDRSSQASRLTSLESYKFRRALYRLWLYFAVYGLQVGDDKLNENQELDEEDEDEDDNQFEDIFVKRQSFLNCFTGLEFDEIDRISDFFEETTVWTVCAEASRHPSLS